MKKNIWFAVIAVLLVVASILGTYGYIMNHYRFVIDNTDAYITIAGKTEHVFTNDAYHTATCAVCGKIIEVPFKPSENRPIYCTDCMGED